jgi:hypothetical protein
MEAGIQLSFQNIKSLKPGDTLMLSYKLENACLSPET